MTWENVFDKHFEGSYRQSLYFHGSDILNGLCGDTWLKLTRQADGYLVWLASNEFEEMPIKYCSKPEQLDELVKILVYL